MSWWNKNILTRLFRNPACHTSRRPQPTRFRPSVLPLEDRTVPSGSDLFATATELTSDWITVTGSNVGATGEVGEPDHAYSQSGSIGTAEPLNSIWWQWTATTSGNVEIKTFGSDFDTVLAVYTGVQVDNLVEVASNDDAVTSGGPSQVRFDAVAGTTYFIAVDGFESATGNITLTLGAASALPNDQFTSATVVSSTTLSGTNIGATGEVGESGHVGDPGPITSVWWQWTATQSGQAEVNTLGSDFDTVLAVYTGSSVDNLTLIAGNDDATGGVLQSQVFFAATADTTYYFVVDGFLNQTGNIVLNVPGQTGSNNNPPVIDPQTFSVNENSSGATVVGTVVADDPDAGQTLTYSITAGNTNNAFTINSTTGEIKVFNSAALDYETNPTFALTVMVTDSGDPALSNSATITVNLNDVNETPVINPAGPFPINENSPAGTVVGTAVTASDVDAGDTLTFSITGGNTNNAFAINPTTGEITVNNSAALDFETTPVFNLTVTVTDNGGLSSSTTITINLNDVDDNSPTYFLGVLSNEVTDLLDDGYLTSNQASDLQNKLDNVAAKLAMGNTNAALNNLNSFTNQVMSLMNQGTLTAAQGQELLDLAEALRLAILG